jgi:hypothetical protein
VRRIGEEVSRSTCRAPTLRMLVSRLPVLTEPRLSPSYRNKRRRAPCMIWGVVGPPWRPNENGRERSMSCADFSQW